MIDQLAVIAGETVPPATSAAAQDGLRRHLVEAAAARLGETGERLVLVVDGLDEDTGTRPGSGRASIASLLPRRPPDRVRVLVTSREQPPLPADVPGDHPLRRCQKRKLPALAIAHDVETQAGNELLQRLHADGSDREVIALITAAGGGLTSAELAGLTGRMHLDIEAQLCDRVRAFAGIIGPLAASDPGRAARLADEAEDVARTVRGYAGQADALARLDPQRALALARIARALAESQPQRAADVASDAARIFAMPPPHLHYEYLRADIAVPLAATGQWKEAEQIARSDSSALAAIAGARAAAGQWERAEQIARSIDLPRFRAQALTDVARMLAVATGERRVLDRAAGWLADAANAARDIADPQRQAEALMNIGEALPLAAPSAAGDRDGDTRARVRRLLGQALAGDRWRDAVPALGRIDPQAVIALQDWLGV